MDIGQLVRRGQELGMSYWRAGPGTPGALGYLSEAISTFGEAHKLLGPEDPVRGHVGWQLGWLLWARYSTHGGSPQDRETGIKVFGEALSSPGMQPAQTTIAHLALGQLYLTRAVEAMNPMAARGGFLGGTSGTAKADVDLAIRCFRQVLDGAAIAPELTTTAETLLTIAEAIRPLLSGDLAGVDISKVMGVMTLLQDMQRGGGPFARPGAAGMPSPFSFPIDLTDVDPLDYPVLDAQGWAPETPTPPPRRPAPVLVAPVAPDAARQAARKQLAGLSELPSRPAWEQALALLQLGPEQMPVAGLDAFIGAAVNAAYAAHAADAAGDEAVEAGLDHLLAATGLCLRERRDGSGWGDEDADTNLAAAEQLLTAAKLIPADHLAAAAVVDALGGMLDETRPLAGQILGQFEAYAAEVSLRPASVVALSELCRMAGSGRSGDPEPLAAAVSAVQEGHFAYAALSTAVQQVRLAAAVRARDSVAVRTALGSAPEGLAKLLDGLIHRPETLRATVDELARGAVPPRSAAVIGATYLELHPEQRDLDTAIRLLSSAVEELGDAFAGLRTRSWWRLATAYRHRGRRGDSDLSRDAGMNALRGGGQDKESAAWFAGQMLADGHSAEAFTALEVAATASGRSVQLAEDVLDVVLGIEPQALPPVEVPTPTEVAAAVRRVEAAALIYLHPTDDAGRTVGVLCLDPVSDRLDILGNVPVNGQLPLDDPGWSAITRRWSGGTLLVAANGELGRIAVPAVRTSAGHHFAQDVSVSYVSSGGRVIDLADRPAIPVTDAPLFVVNPRGDRDLEMAEVMVLRRLFYPSSTCVGRAIELVDAAGTTADVVGRLRGASMTHLACGLRHGEVPGLLLANGDVLDVRDDNTQGQGLVVLAEPSSEGFVAVADAFLDAGFSSAIGWQWAVPAQFAELALFMTHLMHVDHGLPPAAAVNAVHRWMLDPDRVLPPLLTGAHVKTVETVDLTRPALWAALACRGR